jgi:hypothetical protein
MVPPYFDSHVALIASSLSYPKAHDTLTTYISLPDLSYLFRCVIHHPQGELRILAQNCQLFTRLLHNSVINL